MIRFLLQSENGSFSIPRCLGFGGFAVMEAWTWGSPDKSETLQAAHMADPGLSLTFPLLLNRHVAVINRGRLFS